MRKKNILIILLIIFSIPIFAKTVYYEDSGHVGLISINVSLYYSDIENSDIMWNEFLGLKNKAENLAYLTNSLSESAGNLYITGVYKNGILYQIALDWFYDFYTSIGQCLIHKGRSSYENSTQIFFQSYNDFNLLYAEYERQCKKYIDML